MGSEDWIGTPKNQPTIPDWMLTPTPANNKIYAWAGESIDRNVQSWADSQAKREELKWQENTSFITSRGRAQSAEGLCWTQIDGWLQDGTITAIDLTPVGNTRRTAAKSDGGCRALNTNDEIKTANMNEEKKSEENRGEVNSVKSTPRESNDVKYAAEQDATGESSAAYASASDDGRGTITEMNEPTTPQRPRIDAHKTKKGKEKATVRSDGADNDDGGGAAARNLFGSDSIASDDGGADAPNQIDRSNDSTDGGGQELVKEGDDDGEASTAHCNAGNDGRGTTTGRGEAATTQRPHDARTGLRTADSTETDKDACRITMGPREHFARRSTHNRSMRSLWMLGRLTGSVEAAESGQLWCRRNYSSRVLDVNVTGSASSARRFSNDNTTLAPALTPYAGHSGAADAALLKKLADDETITETQTGASGRRSTRLPDMEIHPELSVNWRNGALSRLQYNNTPHAIAYHAQQDTQSLREKNVIYDNDGDNKIINAELGSRNDTDLPSGDDEEDDDGMAHGELRHGLEDVRQVRWQQSGGRRGGGRVGR